MRGDELKAGDALRSTNGAIYILERRKTVNEAKGHPGWWVLGGGGFADFVLEDSDYEHVGRLDPYDFQQLVRKAGRP